VIIWTKASAQFFHRMGVLLSPATRSADAHEYVLVFSRQMYARESTDGNSTLTREDSWNTNAASGHACRPAKSIGHTATFPVNCKRPSGAAVHFSAMW
jgi:hypothetical protein